MSVGIARIRAEPDVIRKGCIDKGEDPGVVDRALDLDEQVRALRAAYVEDRTQQKAIDRRIGEIMREVAIIDKQLHEYLVRLGLEE